MARSKGRQKFLPLQEPNPVPLKDGLDRDAWIKEVHDNFVSPSTANKLYYRVVLELLWPKGHGIPGPTVTQNNLREAIDKERKKSWPKKTPYKPYVDVFRRIRELQGEEGVTGIAREGNRYQLVDLELDEKRNPRIKLSDEDWQKVLTKYGHACAVCGRKEPEVKFDQDHKVPRVRNGKNDLDNWQPLCHECNNFKSTSCRGCTLDCYKCPWAFPEKYAPISLSQENIEKLREIAIEKNIKPSDILNDVVKKYLKY
jgi:5-methylcytosine-specific restriction endonuclease McrA